MAIHFRPGLGPGPGPGRGPGRGRHPASNGSAICRICMSLLRVEWSRSTSRSRTRTRTRSKRSKWWSDQIKEFCDSTSCAGRAPKRMKMIPVRFLLRIGVDIGVGFFHRGYRPRYRRRWGVGSRCHFRSRNWPGPGGEADAGGECCRPADTDPGG